MKYQSSFSGVCVWGGGGGGGNTKNIVSKCGLLKLSLSLLNIEILPDIMCTSLLLMTYVSPYL